MSTRWENVVILAREVDAAYAAGKTAGDLAARLARAVLDFQRELSGSGGPASRPPRLIRSES